MREDKREMTAKEFLDSLSNLYYPAEIKEAEKRKWNVQRGVDEWHGINSYRSEKIYTGKEKQRRVKQIDGQIKRLKEFSKKLSIVLDNVHRAMRQADAIARDRAAISAFDDAVNALSRHRATEKGDEAFKHFTRTIELWRKKRKRNLFFSDKQTREKNKISRKMYKLLKKNQKLAVGKRGTTISSEIKKTRYSLESVFDNYYYDRYTYYRNNLDGLGISKDKLKRLESVLLGKTDYEFHYYAATTALDTARKYEAHIELLEKKYYYYHFGEIKSYCHEIIELSRELYYVDEIINIFSSTPVAKTKNFEVLKDISASQKKHLREMAEKVRKMAEKEDLEKICEAVDRLEKLFSELREKETRFTMLRNETAKAQYYNEYTDLLTEIGRIRGEMYSILKKYPKLYRHEFGKDLDPNRTEDKKVETEPVKAEPTVTRREPVSHVEPKTVTTEIRHVEDTTTVEPTVVERKPRQEEVAPQSPAVEAEPKKESAPVEKPRRERDRFEQIEMPEHLHAHSMQHYQNYMKEKLLKTDLGKLSFSAYLEKVAPYLTELIEVEKEREKQARTVYSLYLKYLAQQEDKRNCMSFREFARIRYDLTNIDVPIEYEEEEAERRKRK